MATVQKQLGEILKSDLILTGDIPGASASVPIGGIIMWSGSIATIPADWALCDGTANAPGPDLREKFIVGASVDAGGVAKTNIEGTLKVTGGVTGHSHSGHANLTHAGLTIGDHTGLTHALSIADHPDLTHPALSHPALTITHADHSVASATHTHAAITLTHADHSIASFSGTNAAITLTHADHTLASFSEIEAAYTLTHADHSFPSLSHQDIGTHVGTVYGVHTITQPADHGVAGTLVHSFNEPDDHVISAHDTVL